MSRPSPPRRTRPPAGPTVPGQVAVYLMSDYTRGNRKPGSFHIITFEEGQTDHIDRFVPHRHDFFEIIWLRSGRGQLRSDLRRYPVGPQTLVFTSPGQVHAWELEGAAGGEIASFTQEFFSVSSDHPGFLAKLPFLYSGSVDPLLRLNATESRQIEEIFQKLHSEAAQTAPGSDDLVRAYLTILLTLARQFFARRPPSPTTPPPVADLLSRRFRLALEENFPRLLEAGEFAKLLGVSRTHLNETLQRELGRPASEMIHERLVLEAKRLLAHTTMPAAQIAYRLRFQDPSYFGRFFRHRTGKTPGEFRDQARTDLLAG